MSSPCLPMRGLSGSVAAVKGLLDQSRAQSVLLVQSSSPAAGTFVQMPSVIVLSGSSGLGQRCGARCPRHSGRKAFCMMSQVGAAWTAATAGRNAVERLNGLGTLLFANRGPLLFLSNDPRFMGAGARPD